MWRLRPRHHGCPGTAAHNLQTCPSRAYAIAGRRSQHVPCRNRSLTSRLPAQPLGDSPAVISDVDVGTVSTAPATSTVDVLLTGLEDFPDSTSIEEAAVEEVASEGSREEEQNPYTADDALRPPPPAGSPELEALLTYAEQKKQALNLDQLQSMFPFRLDSFQMKSVQQLLEGKSVVVCAPTGAGKTAIAEAAATATLAKGQRVIYTTPLKALSNQKLYEKRLRFGAHRVGLQTGDTSLNTDADIVVMTTEILRNIMYRTAETTGGSSGATRDERLGDVGLVVLDEVHYLGDPWRGSVWEEVIINCPKHIQLLCMSATVKNPDDLGGWISQEHGECVTIKTRFRPVPLRWLFGYRSFPSHTVVMSDLTDSSGRKLNDRLRLDRWVQAEQRAMLRRQGREPLTPEQARILEQEFKQMSRSGALISKVKGKHVPQQNQVLAALQSENMLPAIWFIMNRKDCDLSAINADLVLTSEEEQDIILQELQQLRSEQPDAVRESCVQALICGAASHHAGCLPGWKTLVERLFQRGLVKLVFATGTLAAGINMPARTTIISSLARRTDEGIRLLPHNELLQMAGRAGRRGYDTQGNCLILQTRFEGADEAHQIITQGPEPLISQFSTSYSLVLNLLSVYSLQEAKEFLSRTFGMYQSGAGLVRRRQEIKDLQERAAALIASFEQSASTSVKEAQVRYKAERAKLNLMRDQLMAQRVAAAEKLCNGLTLQAALEQDPPPMDIIQLDLSKNPRADGPKPERLWAIAFGFAEEGPPLTPPQNRKQQKTSAAGKYLYCITSDNKLMCVNAVHVVASIPLRRLMELQVSAAERRVVGELLLESVQYPNTWSNATAKQFSCQVTLGSLSTAQMLQRMSLPSEHFETLPVDQQLLQAVQQQQAVCTAMAAEMKDASATEPQQQQQRGSNGSGKRNRGREPLVQAKRLMRQAAQLEGDLEAEQENTWQGFLNVLDVLVQMGAMDEHFRLQGLGLLARGLNGSNELWMALALSVPGLEQLTGPQLASYLGAILSMEVSRRNLMVWAEYEVSPEVVEMIDRLEPMREALFEAQTVAGCERWNEGLLVDLRLAGLVEAWAAGASWQEVVNETSMDDGDMARVLARTMDMLKQILMCQHLLPFLVEPAKEALQGMCRSPVADLVL